MYVQPNIEGLSCNHCCSKEAVSITYSECVCVCVCVCVAVFNQYAKRTRRIILSYVACSDLAYFTTLSHKWHNHRKKLLNIKFLLIFSTSLCEIVHILRRTELDIITNLYRSSYKVAVIRVRL
jgi:hypothetical protein